MVLQNALANAAQNPQLISVFQKETQLLCTLDHPNIVSCYGMITRHNGDLLMYCVMERLEIDLFAAITNGIQPLGKDKPSLFVDLLASFVSALAYLHSPVSTHTCLFKLFSNLRLSLFFEKDVYLYQFMCVKIFEHKKMYSENVGRQLDKKPIVHRDLKPQNIMLDKNNVLKVIDFGLAKETLSGVGSTQNLKGTEIWMAPEQVWCAL